MKRLNQFLLCRNGNWHYTRRVPDRYAHLDQRGRIRASLRTTSLEIARRKRDDLADADEAYWSMLVSQDIELTSEGTASKTEVAINRYKAAKKRAMARGYIYAPTTDLVESTGLNEIVSRLADALKRTEPVAQKQEVEALLGGPKPVAPTVSAAFEIYCKDLAIGDLKGKSDAQKASWKKVKLRAVKNFIALCGDLPMDKITRKHGRDFYIWWGKRLNPEKGVRPLHPNSANRDIGNMRKLYRVYWEYVGDEKRDNPFRNLRYADNVYKDRPAFTDEWVRTKILRRGALSSLNDDARYLVYGLIETGCRPSELGNLTPENIYLNVPIPYIEIKPRSNRQIKTKASSRMIPLVGVSLEAFKHAPAGFPRYKDRDNQLSATLMKAFRVRGLLPTKEHCIYSLRHSFENRMLEAGIDRDLRCTLFGHSNARPNYGDGGSLEFRRDELLKIAHPVPEDFSETLNGV